MDRKTVIVVGAGASNEAGLPTGSELKNKISKLLDIRFGGNQISGDYIISDSLRSHVNQLNGSRDINPYLHAAWHIRDAMPQAISIDNFIDTHSENEKISLCGKLAIVRSILQAEKTSLLNFDDSKIIHPDYSSLDKTWYNYFMRLITENCGISDLGNRFKSISLIIFNYDRCIEHFLYHSLQTYYGIDSSTAIDLLSNIEFFHPYGTVGSLHWQQRGETIHFGDKPHCNQLLELAKQIKTFTEGTDPESSEIVRIKNNVNKANTVIFLGFAFHKLNMRLISPSENLKTDKNVKFFATTHGISDSDKKIINEQILKLRGGEGSVNMANLSCKDFFSEFWRSLSF